MSGPELRLGVRAGAWLALACTLAPVQAQDASTALGRQIASQGGAPAVGAAACRSDAVLQQAAGAPRNCRRGGEYGKVIRLGERVFTNTGKLAARYVGNDLSCANCHLDAGRKADSAPLWASFIHYPAYRADGPGRQADRAGGLGRGEFMNSHERPQDPRYAGSVAATRKKYHDTEDSMYGLTVNGRVLGSGG